MPSRISIPLNRAVALKNLKVDKSRICFITTYPHSITGYKTEIKNYEDFRLQFDDVADLYTIELCPYKESSLSYLPNVYPYFCGNNFYIQTKAINEFLQKSDIKDKYEYFALIDSRVRFKENFWLSKTVAKLNPNKIVQGFKTVAITKDKCYESAAYLYSKQNYNLKNIMFFNGVYGYFTIFPISFIDTSFIDLPGIINYEFLTHQCLVDQVHHRDIMRLFNNYYIDEMSHWLKKLRDNKWTETLTYSEQQIEIPDFRGIQAEEESWRMHEHTLHPIKDFHLNKFNKRIPVHFNHDYRRRTKQE